MPKSYDLGRCDADGAPVLERASDFCPIMLAAMAGGETDFPAALWLTEECGRGESPGCQGEACTFPDCKPKGNGPSKHGACTYCTATDDHCKSTDEAQVCARYEAFQERGPCLFPSCQGQCGTSKPCGPCGTGTSGACARDKCEFNCKGGTMTEHRVSARGGVMVEERMERKPIYQGPDDFPRPSTAPLRGEWKPPNPPIGYGPDDCPRGAAVMVRKGPTMALSDTIPTAADECHFPHCAWKCERTSPCKTKVEPKRETVETLRNFDISHGLLSQIDLPTMDAMIADARQYPSISQQVERMRLVNFVEVYVGHPLQAWQRAILTQIDREARPDWEWVAGWPSDHGNKIGDKMLGLDANGSPCILSWAVRPALTPAQWIGLRFDDENYPMTFVRSAHTESYVVRHATLAGL